MNQVKPFWASKTLWVNLIALIASITAALGLDLGLDEKAQASIVGGVMAVVNIILRLWTNSGVAIKRVGGSISGLLLLIVVAVACTGAPDVRWAQAQSAYNATAKTLEMYRAPCVDKAAYANAGPDHPLCRVDNATWAVVYPILREADRCLKAADKQLQIGTAPAIEDALGCAESALERLIVYRLSSKED